MSFTRKFTSAFASCVIALASPALAQEQALPAPVETKQVPAADKEISTPPVGPALWKVADEDTTIYLFGTVHALPKDVAWLKGNVEQALASSDTLVTEIKTDENTPAEMQKIILAKGVLPEGTTLRSLLDDNQKAAYEQAMTKLGLPVSAFDRFEPWYASMMLSMLPLLKQGYSPDSGVEKVLVAKGGDARKRGELETVQYQLSVFDSLPMDSQIAFLTEAANQVDTIKSTLDEMIADWLKGDADGLAKLMNEGLSDKVLADRLLYARNRNWADWIDNRLKTPGTVFVAVGAGHLAGKHSVQDALAAHGLTAVRVQ